MDDTIRKPDYESSYPFWNDLTKDEQSRFANSTRLRSYKKGEIIHQPDDKCEGMIYMVGGRLRIYILSEDGREITLYRLEKGEICVLSASCVIDAISFDVFIEAETAAEMYLTDAPTLRLLSERNLHLMIFNQGIALERFSDIMWTMQQVLFFSVDRRLAGFLLNEADKNSASLVHATHEQIAISIGSAREVVTRMLRRFADDGYIKLARGSVEILDRESLSDIA
ncbi:MAG: Crp/Fnr family transcriptional regulator [Mogibacterium sp.]|nr:Crp/Fnr family transcriptional regulator [Mogibacterium sp.]